ncbi:MAG: hypothetical protein GF350_10470, partial [Chitinivibrionales bacterium]|nr:hypothetical protein [Chitinivibrionales bacterium]
MIRKLLATGAVLLPCICLLFFCSSEQPVAGTETGTETGTLTGSVYDADNSPVANAYVFLHEDRTDTGRIAMDNIHSADSTWTDSDGAFRFDPVSAGDYFVEINAGDSLGVVVSTRVPERETESVVGVVEPMGSIVGTIDSALATPGRQLYVYIAELERFLKAGPAGSFSILNVPYGNFSLYIMTQSGGILAECDSVPVRKGEQTIVESVGTASG